MKKIAEKVLALVCCLSLVLTMAACSGNSTNGDANVPNEPTNTQQDVSATTNEEPQNTASNGKTTVPEDFTYTEANGEITITGYNGEASILQIPDTIAGKPVTTIGEKAFANDTGDNIVEVIMPDSIKVIGTSAFDTCSNLTTIDIGNSVQIIEAFAFYQTPLSGIVFPDTVEAIGANAFTFTKITQVTIPPLVKIIGNGAFAVTNIETVTIPGTITEIGERAFQHCASLKSVVIEEGVEIICEDAFDKCDTLESITFPASVTEMGDGVVYISNGTVRLYVPAGSVVQQLLTEEYGDYKSKYVIVVQ